MPEMEHAEHPEVRQRIAEAISRTFFRFVKRDGQRIEEALSLLATDRTIRPGTVKAVREFYEEGDDQKEAFLEVLASLGARKVEYVLNQIYAAMDTPEWLITIREDLNRLSKKRSSEKSTEKPAQAFKELRAIFKDHFTRIFNFQYLVTRFCDASSTSISLLKFIAQKEGVHPAEHWWSFENRLNSPDHIILSLEHFKMPYIPLVYIEVALSRGLIRRITKIVGDKRRVLDVSRADTAIFYSVNSTMNGLKGVGLGEKMVIRAKEYLEEHYPQIKHFATLSPLPKFADYLMGVLKSPGHEFRLSSVKIDVNRRGRFFSNAEIKDIKAELSRRMENVESLPLSDMLRSVFDDGKWSENKVFKKRMKGPLTALTRYYLEKEKRRDRKTGKPLPSAYDPVANFHLSNGAYVGSINYLGNPSERGLKESFGMMVNYIYDERRLDANKLLYNNGEVVIKL
jgi:malonyl-CoA decarboxylase